MTDLSIRKGNLYRLRMTLIVLASILGMSGTDLSLAHSGPAQSAQSDQAQAVTLTLQVPQMLRDLVTPSIIQEFEIENPGIKVQLGDTSVEFGNFSITALDLDATAAYASSGDVLFVDNTSLTAASTYAHQVLDLYPLAASDPNLSAAEFYPAVWNSFQWDGGIWGLPVAADVAFLSYQPQAFDAAGLAYPTPNWTIDDFANAVRLLAVRDGSGNVITPGMFAGYRAENLGLFLRSLAGGSLFDNTVIPNPPDFSDPALEHVLQIWAQLEAEGVVTSQISETAHLIPLSVNSSFGLAMLNSGDPSIVRASALLPDNNAGLYVQGFAVSASTANPEAAYALAKFLTNRPELAGNFLSASPARQNLPEVQAAAGGLVGPPVSPEVEMMIQTALPAALPVAELRFAPYLLTALETMQSTGVDARTALQNAEYGAASDMQAAITYGAEHPIYITTAPGTGAVSAGGSSLTFGLGTLATQEGIAGQDGWNALINDFVAKDPAVASVNLSPASESFAVMAEQFDCFIMPYNAVPGSNLSGVLSLDPFIDADPAFDKADVLGTTLVQLQVDHRTWAFPMAIQPQVLRLNPALFQQAGVPVPENGWTVEAFVDALYQIKTITGDAAPFSPFATRNGDHLLMLIAGFGGLPVDFRTNPPAMNYTDPATMDAIRQVLDLARGGYIDYQRIIGNYGSDGSRLDPNNMPAMSTDLLTQFGFGNETQATRLVTYPQGSRFSIAAYDIVTGYISANAANPEACYRFLSDASRSPHLFSGMPVRRSLMNDPVVLASQNPQVTALYNQIEQQMQDPGMVIFPRIAGMGTDVSLRSFIERYWLFRAFDRYVLDGADLAYELQDAEMHILSFRQCVAAQPDTNGVQVYIDCAFSVDASFSL